MLPSADIDYLESKGFNYQITVEGGVVCLVISGFRLPDGYDCAQTDLLLRFPAGYPDAQPDMFWCDPPIRLSTGAFPMAADLMESYLGRTWQRFSRHLGPGVWKPGIDGLNSYLALVGAELHRSATAA